MAHAAQLSLRRQDLIPVASGPCLPFLHRVARTDQGFLSYGSLILLSAAGSRPFSCLVPVRLSKVDIGCIPVLPGRESRTSTQTFVVCIQRILASGTQMLELRRLLPSLETTFSGCELLQARGLSTSSWYGCVSRFHVPGAEGS